MPAWHVTLSSTGRMPLFDGHAAVRAAVRALVRALGRDLALFCLVDEHVHAVLTCAAEHIGHRVRALLLCLRPHCEASLAHPWVRPIEDRTHAERLLGYILGQPLKHGLPEHPALWCGSAFQDLVGARWLPHLGPDVRRMLPRFGLRDALRAVGLAQRPIEPATLRDVRSLGAARLVAAAAAALFVEPGLPGRLAQVVVARRATAQLGAAAGIAIGELAWALGRTPRAIRYMTVAPAPADALRAAQIRLRLELTVGRSPGAGIPATEANRLILLPEPAS